MNRFPRRIAMTLGFASIVAGCVPTSIAGMRKHESEFVLSSTHTPDDIARCLGERWLKKGGVLQITPRVKGVTVTISTPAILLSPPLFQVLVELDEAPGGSTVDFRAVHDLYGNAFRDRQDDVRACS